jgi:hypothetical protein
VETTKPIAGSVVGDLFYWAAGNVVNYVTESSEKKKAQERPYLEGLTNSRLFYWWLATLPGIKRLTFLPGSEADLILNYFLKFENCVNRWEFLQALGYPLSDRENAMLSVGQKMRTIYDDYGIHPKAYMVLPDSNPIIKPEQLDRYQGKELKERVRTNRGLVNLILFILYNQPARAMAVAQSVEKTFNSYYRKFGGGEIQSMIYALWVMLLNPSRFGFRESPIEILGSLDKIVGAAVKNDQCFDTYLSERDGFKGRPG